MGLIRPDGTADLAHSLMKYCTSHVADAKSQEIEPNLLLGGPPLVRPGLGLNPANVMNDYRINGPLNETRQGWTR